MAGHEWEDWFEREEFIGQISDIRVQNLQVEREMVQKRTFTRWINLHLEKCNPPMEVHDLFRDIQDGRILMALLEELSGCKLLQGFKQSSHRIFRLNNIAKVLTFLEERNVKLVSIDAADVADGNSSIVLGLIWNIILFFQIKELTGNIKNQFPSSSSLSSIPTSSDSDTSHSSTPSEERRCSVAIRDHGKAIRTLLQWVQRRTRKFGVAVNDFGKSWTSGLAFLAVIKSIDPSLVDMRRALLRTSRENLEEAFRTAHYSLGIARLLEPEDVTINPPDEQVIMTYVSQFLEHFPGMDEDDVSDVIDRSTSKVSARLNDSVARNGGKRVRETSSYVVKRDWVKPPPKIFISAVSDESTEQQVAKPPPSSSSSKAWASEESSPSPAESSPSPSPADDRSPTRSLDLTKDASCPVSASTSSSSSPQPSYVDSVISSPDSWSEMPSEVGPLEKLPESYSDGSLNETSLVCDAKESVTYSQSQASDKGLPFETEKPLDDGMDSELFIDEGNFSLCSLDSLQAKTPLPSEEDAVALTHIPSAQGQDKVPELGGVANGSAVGSEEKVHHETVKPSPADLSDGACESGYFPEDKESSLSLASAESALASLSSDEQIVQDENQSKEKTQHPEWADHLQPSFNAEQTPDRMTDQITEADEPAVVPGCPVSGNSVQLPESESDIRSEDMALADVLEAQQEDIHYAENVDVESAEDSDGDGEVAEQPARGLEVETPMESGQPEESNAKQQEEESEEDKDEVKPVPHDPQGLGLCEAPGASSPVLNQEKGGQGTVGEKMEATSPGDVEETSDGIVTEITDLSSVEVTTNQKMTSGVDSDFEVTDRMYFSSSAEVAEVNDHEEKSGMPCGEGHGVDKTSEGESEPESAEVEMRESVPECETEDEQSYTKSKPDEALASTDSQKPASQHDGMESSDDPAGQTQSKSAEIPNGTEWNAESSVKEGAESWALERRTGAAWEPRHEPAGAEAQPGAAAAAAPPAAAAAGHPEGALGDAGPSAGDTRLEEKNDHEADETDETVRAPVSVIPLDLVYYPHYDVPIAEVIEAFAEPSATNPRGQGEAGAAGRGLNGSDEAGGGAEDCGSVPQELRLALSVAPLQPAPAQDRLPGPDTDSSDSEMDDRDRVQTPAEPDEGLPRNMTSDGPGQSPEPGHTEAVEGLAEADRDAGDPDAAGAGGSGELIKKDGEWTSARENMTTLREHATEDPRQPSMGPYLRASALPIEDQSGYKKSGEPCTPDKISLYRRRGSKPEKREPPVELTLEEICLLLVLWLIVYCLFVLPQIDFRTLPQLLLNIEE
ncbi:calmin isoform X2 [Alosa sapidissima]|uniref:calmin isoform X2 n=1 Tax=Alosa sapidissima TaxID=34773 RepID=UPI001C0A4FE4|nr:calmin isoform X2 [Alosa sapidissima]